MLGSEVFSSSSSTVVNFNADDCQRIADFVERKLAKALSLHIREVIGSAFAAEAAKWSAHLGSALQCMEQTLIDELNMRSLTPASGAAYASGDMAPIAGSSAPHFGGRRETCEHHPFAPSAYESECSSIHSITPRSLRKRSNRRRQSRCAPQLAERDVGSIERRLANDIFAAKLGASLGESQEFMFAGSSDQRMEPGLASVSFSSSIGPSSEVVDGSEVRSPSLEAIDSETPKKFDMAMGSRMSLRSSQSLESIASQQAKQWSQATRRFQHTGLNPDGDLQFALVRTFVKWLPRLLGVLPWNLRYRLSSMMYQAFIALVAIWAAVTITKVLFERVRDENVGMLEMCLCIILSGGGLLGLCSCLYFNKQIVFSTSLLESYAAHTQVGDDWDKQSFKDTCFVIIVVAFCMGLENRQGWADGLIEVKCAVVFGELLLLAFCSQVLRFSRCLCLATDAYCGAMGEDTDLANAVQEWLLLHATCRSVCESIQLCFIVLQSVAIGIIILPFLSLVNSRSLLEMLLLPHMIPGALCAIVMVHLSVCAASFTNKCERVPVLILSFCRGDFDANRMYLVDYIERSRTAFYIFNVRLRSAIVLKTFYVASAAAFSLTSHALMAEPLT